MSKIGRRPINLPGGVQVKIEGRDIEVKGPKGSLSWTLPEGISCVIEDNQIIVERGSDTKTQRSLHGLSRALINNMVVGVSEGYERHLEIVGVGYKAQMKGKTLVLNLGFSHPVEFTAPEGVEIKTPNPTRIIISGIDKHLVGQTAANIRAVLPPEPYKGKGIRYAGEEVRKKLGKAVGK